MTGLPLDYKVLSIFCFKCKSEEGKDVNEEWMAKHKENCPKNFDGSAGAMEVECAKILWSRSVDKCNVRYTTILCDGDSKAFDAVTDLNVYGPANLIQKEDCINHVSKTMGTALRNLVASSKAQKDSTSGKGKLTLQKVAKMLTIINYPTCSQPLQVWSSMSKDVQHQIRQHIFPVFSKADISIGPLEVLSQRDFCNSYKKVWPND